jgi:hypothetical protein
LFSSARANALQPLGHFVLLQRAVLFLSNAISAAAARRGRRRGGRLIADARTATSSAAARTATARRGSSGHHAVTVAIERLQDDAALATSAALSALS